METQNSDPGLGIKYNKSSKRFINKNGSYNIKRHGEIQSLYDYLLSISWAQFFLLFCCTYLVLNLLVALLYFSIGLDSFSGMPAKSEWERYLFAFYFSMQTSTTVGYGGIHPVGHLASFLAGIEALFSLVGFALVTGLVYGRFSKPKSFLKFSENVLVSPYKDKLNALMFRVVNKGSNNLMDLEAKVILSYTDEQKNRKYFSLNLEISNIIFFPLSWTIVHPIDEKSVFYGKNEDDIHKMDFEIMILIKGFDETYGQPVHQRTSYNFSDFVWGGKFMKVYDVDDSGEVSINLDRINDHERVKIR